MDNLLIALALVLILEGIWPMLFPNKWRSYVQKMAELPTKELQMMGGIMVLIGVIALWLL